MRKKAVILFVVVACLLLSACGKGYFRATYEGGEETVEFYEDGTMEMYKGNMVIEGTYERIEKNTYDVRINALLFQMRYTVVRDKEGITVTDNSDETSVYTYYLVK